MRTGRWGRSTGKTLGQRQRKSYNVLFSIIYDMRRKEGRAVVDFGRTGTKKVTVSFSVIGHVRKTVR